MSQLKRVFYLPNCDTSKRVIKEARLGDDFDFQDIKKKPLTPQQLDELAVMAGSYEALFSRRSREYQKRELKNEYLNEKDYRDLILEHYSFLKRPVVVYAGQAFVGSSEKVVNQLINELEKEQP
ncbi:MAG TPA: ArsC/Spx/MgsR family protein [Bacteroidales bacterium]|nr:ArsC/Spx/MgsR family protein [Bacteroidales bacterium]